MLRTPKAKNARSKRAMEKKEPKAIEDVKTCLFVKSTSCSSTISTSLTQLHSLKKPQAIMFGNKSSNSGIRPFEDAKSLEFWSLKNDAALVMLGSSSKKRPHNLTLARMFNHQVLDMLEFGVQQAKAMTEYAARKPSVGQKPLFHFSGDLFETHPVYKLFKSLILDLYHGEETNSVNLAGLQHVLSLTIAPASSSSSSSSLSNTSGANRDTMQSTSIVSDITPLSSSSSTLPIIHFRVYMIKLLKSNNRSPFIHLDSCGPSFDFSLRRHQEASNELWKQATKTFKRKNKSDGGAQAKKRSKNWDTDEMGDKVGRLHVGNQDLSKLQSRKMKGLKRDKRIATTTVGGGEGDGSASDASMTD